jgi:cardiolipin synthase A/B
MKYVHLKTPPSTPTGNGNTWKKERLYFEGDRYFADLLKSIGRARRSVDFETYIFEKGWLGERVVSALVRVARRGVRVRLLVDGVGSPDFASHYGPRLAKGGIAYHVYRSWPVFFATAFNRLKFIHPASSFQAIHAIWTRGKHRDHRKQVIVDGRDVWLGSFNVSDWHLRRRKGKAAWRDTGVVLRGISTPAFRLAFHMTWLDRWPRRWRDLRRRMLVRWLTREVQQDPVRITANRGLRRLFRRELLDRMETARRRIWITTPYFVPTGALLKELGMAAQRGCDVRILVPAESDVPMVRWTSIAFYPKLLRAGCRLYEFQKRVLHAKTTLVDDWAMVGSSNLDQRSLRKDLEINVMPQDPKSRKLLEGQFQLDLGQSQEVTLAGLKKYPWRLMFLSWIFFRFRSWF